jgi:hypothetical protein
MSNFGSRSKMPYQGVTKSICLVWLLFVGQYGLPGTRHVLRKKMIKSPHDITFSTCMFLCYWAGLYADED